MKADDIAQDSINALEEQLKRVTEFEPERVTERTEETELPEAPQESAKTEQDDDIRFGVRPEMVARLASVVLEDEEKAAVDEEKSAAESLTENTEQSDDDKSAVEPEYFTQPEENEPVMTDDSEKSKLKAAKMLKVRRIMAIICYTLCLVAYGASGWLAYTTYSKEMSFVQGILTFLPIWITTYWFSTFFADLIEIKQEDGSYKFLIDKRTRKFMNNFLYVLGLVFIGIWIYLYITQYLMSANNNNVQLTLSMLTNYKL